MRLAFNTLHLLLLLFTVGALPIEIPFLSSLWKNFKSCLSSKSCLESVQVATENVAEHTLMGNQPLEHSPITLDHPASSSLKSLFEGAPENKLVDQPAVASNQPLEILDNKAKTSVQSPAKLPNPLPLISDPLIDKFFPKNLQVIKIMGEGSYGRVFLVRDIITEQVFVLKAYGVRGKEAGYFTTPEMIENEWKIINNHAVNLGHGPIIVNGNKRYLPMRYVEGEVWTSKFDKFKHPESDHMNKVIERRVKRQIEKLHEAGIVHGDLATRNVLVNQDLQPTIIDYGFAKFSSSEIDQLEDFYKLELELQQIWPNRVIPFKW